MSPRGPSLPRDMAPTLSPLPLRVPAAPQGEMHLSMLAEHPHALGLQAGPQLLKGFQCPASTDLTRNPLQVPSAETLTLVAQYHLPTEARGKETWGHHGSVRPAWIITVPTDIKSDYNCLPTFPAHPNRPTALLCLTAPWGNGPGSGWRLQQGRGGISIPSHPVLSHPTPYLFLLQGGGAQEVLESHPFGRGRLSRPRFAPQTKPSFTAILQHP